jgi:hypothetical protein
MSWSIIPEFRLPDEPEALTYIAAVEAADGQTLEPAVKLAINAFIKGCKNDGIWPAIKASCILAGARTLAGALVPLVGAAPTNVSFVSGDYNRETGLVGDGSTKYLDSNQAGNADPQNSIHLSCWVSTVHNLAITTPINNFGGYVGCGGLATGATSIFRSGGAPTATNSVRNRNSATQVSFDPNPPPTGFYGMNRPSSASHSARTGGINYSFTQSSQSPATDNYLVLARNNGSNVAEGLSNARLAFYSIGESLDLALLDARVSALITAFGVAIP